MLKTAHHPLMSALVVSTILTFAITTATLQEKLTAIDSLIRLAQKELRAETAGLAVGIVADGKPLFAEGYGRASHEKAESRVTNRTIFAIASLTKAFTTFAIDDLMTKNGSIEWSDLVIDHIPEFRMSNVHTEAHITVRDLVTHASGLPRHDMVTLHSSMPRNEIISRLKHLETNRELRQSWQYNNLMYTVAGIVMERVTGRSWEENVRERIFKPLNMTRTFSEVDEVKRARIDDVAAPHAAPWGSIISTIRTVSWLDLNQTNPAGGICSCAEDLTKWMTAQLGLSGRSKEMHSAQMNIANDPLSGAPFAYGLGWFLAYHQGRIMLYHTGDTLGFHSVMLLFAEDKQGVVVLTNFNLLAGFIKSLAYKIADMLKSDSYTRLKSSEWVTNQAKAIAQPYGGLKLDNNIVEGGHEVVRAEEYVGRYENLGYGVVEVTAVGSRLFASLNALRYSLVAKHEPNSFSARLPFPHEFLQYECFFVRDSTRNMSGLRFAFEPQVSPIFFEKKVSDALYALQYLKSFIGNFGGVSVSLNAHKRSLFVTLGSTSGPLTPYKRNWFRSNRVFYEFIFTGGVVSELNVHYDEMITVFKKSL